MTRTTIKSMYGDREISLHPYNSTKDLLLSIINTRNDQSEVAWLDENAARNLVAALVSHFGDEILKPKAKTFAEQFGALPLDSYFTINFASNGNELWKAWKRPDGKLVATGLGWDQLAAYVTPNHGVKVTAETHLGKTIVPSDWRPPKPTPQVVLDFRALAVGEEFYLVRGGQRMATVKVSDTALDYTVTASFENLRRYRSCKPLSTDFEKFLSNYAEGTWRIETLARPAVSDAIRALAVGDHFTVAYDNGRTTKGVKVDDERYFSYTTQALRKIATITWKGTLTKENGPQ